MGGTGKNKEPAKKDDPPKKEDRKSKKLPPAITDDDGEDGEDGEDGDIATPKRDRYGDDDQPL